MRLLPLALSATLPAAVTAQSAPSAVPVSRLLRASSPIRLDGHLDDDARYVGSYHDHRTAFGFDVNPAGVRRDSIQTRGVQFERVIGRNYEYAVSTFIPRKESCCVPRYEHLEGLADLSAPFFLESNGIIDFDFVKINCWMNP